jgi:hypothetical protein
VRHFVRRAKKTSLIANGRAAEKIAQGKFGVERAGQSLMEAS